ncbi:MAG: membrane protein [Bdellovibrio sp. ArHS]|uniref:YeiH family protein n=1 Tax=Bdellovibrio sp. ArHS TaxID=1569284 RepID=UPI000583F11B|nr:putative sulfate exporter family transporter [Bdellovibrio sp. ArHS]KHD87361.1 MAG: membrane protein [Bdellovibrio sp. ArHS]
MNSQKIARILFPFAAVLCFHPAVSSALALIAGMVLALTLGNPYQERTKVWTSQLLSLAVVGLGAGMNLITVGQVGARGIGYTVVGIAVGLLLGTLMGRLLKVEKNTSTLITVGTTICGGSAIAAVAPVIRARPPEVSVALGTVFLLNALALFIFPQIGHHFNLSETQFGLWSALAIHDTSSVVGASLQYGPHALEVGTTVKLARALWIVPIALGIGLLYKNQGQQAGEAKAKRPWFILGFLIMAGIMTWVPALQPVGHGVEWVAKRLLVLTLFLIGGNLTRQTVKSVGIKPFIMGVALWIVMATGSLAAILEGWVH